MLRFVLLAAVFCGMKVFYKRQQRTYKWVFSAVCPLRQHLSVHLIGVTCIVCLSCLFCSPMVSFGLWHPSGC